MPERIITAPATWLGAPVPGLQRLSELLDVDLTGLDLGQLLSWDGTEWIPSDPIASAMQGAPGKNYRLCGGPLRNDGAPNYWQPIVDSGHDPANLGAVTTDATKITVNYGVAGLKVVSALVDPDETLAAAGYAAGASVGTALSTLTLARYGAIGDYIFYNGTAWVAALGASSPFTGISFSGGVLTLTHADIGDQAPQNVAVSGRGIGYLPMLQEASPAVSQTQVNVEFYDYAGTKITVPDTRMRAYLERGCKGKVDPRTVTTALLPNSNLWFIAIVEV